MPKVTTVKSARKDYPNFDIKKGDTYFRWSFMRGPTMMSKTYPKRSQLTRSDFFSQLYDMEDFLPDRFKEIKLDDLQSELDNLKDDIENLKSEQEDKLSNMPEQLQESSALNEYIEALDSWISELDGIDIPSEEDVYSEMDDDATDADKVEALRIKAEEVADEITQISSGL
jgi:hypothetical protein